MKSKETNIIFQIKDFDIKEEDVENLKDLLDVVEAATKNKIDSK